MLCHGRSSCWNGASFLRTRRHGFSMVRRAQQLRLKPP
ncbi:hypothetical protein [Polaromonas sp. CG9_12]|nr:hypothetical protein [Polaromonas sp. CG9_12]